MALPALPHHPWAAALRTLQRTAAWVALLGCHQSAAAPSVAITNVTVIDGTDRGAQPGMTVVVTGDRIASITSAASTVIPSGAMRVDGTGKYLIPGLWDMHYHADTDSANQRRFMAMNLANGVVGVREMFGSPAIRLLKHRIDSGLVLGSRVVMGSPLFDGPDPYFPGSVVVADDGDAAAAVARTKADGAAFIKVYMLLPPPAFFAILRAGRAQGIDVVGHVPYAVPAAVASDSGLRSMEHLYDVPFATASNSADLQARAAKLLTADRRSGFGRYNHLMVEALHNYDSTKAAELFAKFRANDTWQVPTLAISEAIARMQRADFATDSAFRYLPESIQTMWLGIPNFFPTWTAADWATLSGQLPGILRMVGDLHRAGVRILAGSDTPNPGLYPGFSLHRELELLVQAGLTPLQALQSATRNPSDYFHADSIGIAAEGRLADLVLLDADPLADISNVRRIGGLLFRGKYYDRVGLERLLQSAGPSPAPDRR